ncbi:hypothetical protein B7463_g5905, partial [Scytalidium lignicola]
MNLLERFSRSQKPAYVLIDRIPASVGPSLLGRIVVDIDRPTDNYRPKKPLEFVQTKRPSSKNTTSIAKSGQGTSLGTSDDGAGKSNQLSSNSIGQTKEETDPSQGSNAKEVASTNVNRASSGEDRSDTVQIEPAKAKDAIKNEDIRVEDIKEAALANTDDTASGEDRSYSAELESATIIEAIKNEQIQVEDSAFSFLFSQNNNYNVQFKLGQILGVTVEKGKEIKVGITSKYVRTRNLTQHYDTLKTLLARHRKEILELAPLVKRKRLYMVVGFKAAVDADMHKSFEEKQSMSLQAAFPAEAVVQAASHGAVNLGNTINPQLDTDGRRENNMNASAKMIGEQIFAIRYRILDLNLKKKSEPIKHGEIMRVKHGEGVYGAGDKELVFEDDDYSEDSDYDEWQDEEIVPSLGSIRNEARFFNKVVVADFDQ